MSARLNPADYLEVKDRLMAYLEHRQQELREENDDWTMSAEQTALVRGRLAEVQAMIQQLTADERLGARSRVVD